jgi:hypothetical protein
MADASNEPLRPLWRMCGKKTYCNIGNSSSPSLERWIFEVQYAP